VILSTNKGTQINFSVIN